jgi:arylsulfatase A-like enzyme
MTRIHQNLANWWLIGLFACLFGAVLCTCSKSLEKPNILWITCEDISPYLGCYGFEQALTPNLDRLAESGVSYTHAYANAPVCAVARSTLLTGICASTTGTHQMRTRTRLPAEIPAYPLILRESGYYCTNNSKTDYNSNYEYEKHSLWDETGGKAHWKNRPEGAPFFAVFNIGVSHESQLSEEAINGYLERGQIPERPRIDPGDIELPPYHPDLPEIRTDWARFHDLITLMDQMVGERLQELEEAGLAEHTIVVFNSDHGGQLARSKRFIYNVGTQIPLIIYLPDKWKHLAEQKAGETEGRLVSFIDFPKTLLSITGCETPESMQGRIFMGPETEPNPDYVHFFRDRQASRYDFSRAVTDGHYYFIRNFMPHRPRGRDTRYGYQVQANWRAWEEYYDAGKCNEIQSRFYQPKPVLQLFHTDADPWYVNNLAADPGQQDRVRELSAELDRWMIETSDLGLVPEAMFTDLAGEGKKYATIYEFGQSTDYHIERILEVARSSSLGDVNRLSEYLAFSSDEDPVVRYWGAYAIFLTRSQDGTVQDALRGMIHTDEFPANRLMAAQALGLCGDKQMAFQSIMKEVTETTRGYVFLLGINAFQYSKTDHLLTKMDWEGFKAREWNIQEGEHDFGVDYAGRIINDALELWPERRRVY